MIVRILVIWLFLLPVYNINSLGSTPEKWFDSQYTDAVDFCKDNQKLILNTLSESCLPPSMALSIAFPEMLRYTLWRDLFETTALELLYVNGGKDLADFSIGWLQMKPSFAEKVEGKIKTDSILINKYSDIIVFNTNSDSIKIRKERVQRLKQFHWQLLYLNAFIDYNCNILRKNNIPYDDFLLYLSATYNSGIDTEITKLKEFSEKKTFPYGPGKENPFSFVEIAEYFYENHAKQLLYNP